MKREIRFRALVSYISGEEPVWEYYNTLSQPFWSDENFYTVLVKDLQYTGLKDNNGKEIYEGDINQDAGKVIWLNDTASFAWEYPIGDIHEFGDEPEWCEVCGNIYQHPNLLNQ